MNVPVTTGEVLTPEEAAAYLRVSRPTLLKAVRRGEVPVLHIGARWRVSRAALDQYLAGAQTALFSAKANTGTRRRNGT